MLSLTIFAQFEANLDEVVLFPKGRGKKYATTCVRGSADSGKKAVGRTQTPCTARVNLVGVAR